MANLWQHYLDGFDDPDRRRQAEEWYMSRPEPIRALVRRYPPGSHAVVHGRPAYVISYFEEGLSMSHVDPSVDYDKAVAERFFVCADHLL
jgi:hypothetical protein